MRVANSNLGGTMTWEAETPPRWSPHEPVRISAAPRGPARSHDAANGGTDMFEALGIDAEGLPKTGFRKPRVNGKNPMRRPEQDAPMHASGHIRGFEHPVGRGTHVGGKGILGVSWSAGLVATLVASAAICAGLLGRLPVMAWTPTIATGGADDARLTQDVYGNAANMGETTYDDMSAAYEGDVYEMIRSDAQLTAPATQTIDLHDGRPHVGVDVSSHNKKIDWEAAKAAGVEFAIIRCGYGSDTTEHDDALWEYNASECERLGIPYGVYLYSYAASDPYINSEIVHTLRLLEGHHPTLPIYYDLEEPRAISAYGYDASAMSRQGDLWCDAIRTAGYRPGIYASKHWFSRYLTGIDTDGVSLWVAQYASDCTYEAHGYDMWQYTATGSVEGIGTRVDMDVLQFGGSPDADTLSAI